jgi:cobalamin synthase
VSVFFRAGLGWPQLIVASGITAVVTLGLLSWPGLLLWALAWLVATLVAGLAMARLGGLTGDIYGAACETTETVLLIAVTAAAHTGLLAAAF